MNTFNAFLGLTIIWLGFNIISASLEGEQPISATRITASINSSDTSVLNVVSTSNFRASNTDVGIRMGRTEIICYTSKTPTTFVNLTRGCNNSKAQTHLTGTRVYNETLGVINSGMGFNIATSDSTGGQLAVIAQGAQFLIFGLPKMLLFSYSFFTGDLMGIPLESIRVFFLAFSLALSTTLLIMLAPLFQSVFRAIASFIPGL
jgi:hypothetical protein